MNFFNKYKVIHFLMYFTFLLICHISLAQSDKNQILIYGKIIGNDTTKPLEGVTVSDSISKIFSISDDKGYYKLIIPRQNTFIKFSCIGYKSIIKSIIPEVNKKIFEVNLSLQRTTVELNAVNISDVIPVYTKKEDWVIDFEFINDSLLLLINEFGKKSLKIINSEGNILSEKNIILNVDKFFKDCLGNIHLMNSDSVYQMYFADNEIFFLKPIWIKDFEQQLKPCITIVSDNFFFYYYYRYNQSLSYFFINKNTKQKIYFDKISNEESISYIETFYKPMLDSSKGIGDFTNENVAPGMGENTNNVRDFEEMEAFFKVILTKPIYSPLFKINDSIFIFDHIKKIVRVFSSDVEKIREFPITYADNKQWANELIVNNEKNAVYAKYLNDGVVKLININLNSGLAEREITIYKLFPSKIKIYKNYIYYLYKDEYSEGENKFLFKQKIE